MSLSPCSIVKRNEGKLYFLSFSQQVWVNDAGGSSNDGVDQLEDLEACIQDGLVYQHLGQHCRPAPGTVNLPKPSVGSEI